MFYYLTQLLLPGCTTLENDDTITQGGAVTYSPSNIVSK